MFELLLIRHGQTDWNIERRVMGAKPIPLNTAGRKQARALASGLKGVPINAIYTSPLKRALQTAQVFLKGRDSIPLVEEAGFSEIDYGDWVGKMFSEVPELPAYFQTPTSITIPNGEDLADVQKRAVSAIDRIHDRHRDMRVMAISHADVIKLILIHYLGLSIDDMYKIRIDNCSISIVRFDSDNMADGGKSPRLIVMNCHGEWEKYCNV